MDLATKEMAKLTQKETHKKKKNEYKVFSVK